MPSNQKGPGPGQGRPQNNGGSAPGAKEQAQAIGQKIQDGAEQLSNRVREGYDSARDQALHGYRQAEGRIARNPGSSVLIGFGVGFGLGLAVCSLLASRREETWAEKYLPERFQDLPGKVKELPERYSSLVDSLKDLPKTVREHLPHSIAKHIG